MADSDYQKFRYEGPPVLIVATGERVEDGAEVEGPPALAATFGFTPVEAKKTKKEEEE